MPKYEYESLCNECDGCCHYAPSCGYFDAPFEQSEEQRFEENCVGCCCGDLFDCNRDQGCDNYEEEPIMG